MLFQCHFVCCLKWEAVLWQGCASAPSDRRHYYRLLKFTTVKPDKLVISRFSGVCVCVCVCVYVCLCVCVTTTIPWTYLICSSWNRIWRYLPCKYKVAWQVVQAFSSDGSCLRILKRQIQWCIIKYMNMCFFYPFHWNNVSIFLEICLRFLLY